MSRARAAWMLGLLCFLAGCAGSNRRNPSMLEAERWSDPLPPEVLGEPYDGDAPPQPELLFEDPSQPRGLSRYFPSLFGRRRPALDWFEGQPEPQEERLSDGQDARLVPVPREELKRTLSLGLGRRIFQRQPPAPHETVTTEDAGTLPTLPVSLVLETYPEESLARSSSSRHREAAPSNHSAVPERLTSLSMEIEPILAIDPAAVAWPASSQGFAEEDSEFEVEIEPSPHDESSQVEPVALEHPPLTMEEDEDPTLGDPPRFQALYARREPGSLPPDLPVNANSLFPPSYYRDGDAPQPASGEFADSGDRPRPRLLERAATLRRLFDSREQEPEVEIQVEIDDVDQRSADSHAWEQDDLAQGG